MNRLLAYLLAFLRLGAGEADPPVEGADAGGGDAAAAGEEPEPDLFALDGGEAPDVPRETAEPDPAAEASARADRAERELEIERQVQQRVQQRSQAPAPQPSQDPQFAAEERQIAEARSRGMSDNDIKWLEWQISTNRTNRRVEQSANRALAEANDVRDQTAFNQLAITKPALHKRYATKVEQTIAGMRARGEAIPPREALMTFLAGQDVINGMGKKVAPAKPAAPVDRGRMPQTRSDISGRATPSERAKRRERLRGQPI